MVTNKAAVDTEFWQYRNDTNKNLGRLQASLDDKTKPAIEEEKECKCSFLSEKYANSQLRHRPVDSEMVGDAQYQLDGCVGKERRVQKSVEFLQR